MIIVLVQPFVWYFAYGSNMDIRQMRKRIGRFPERAPGILRGWRLAFNFSRREVPFRKEGDERRVLIIFSSTNRIEA